MPDARHVGYDGRSGNCSASLSVHDELANAVTEHSDYTEHEIQVAGCILVLANRGDLLSWLLNSGALKHLCNDGTMLKTTEHTVTVFALGDGS